MVGLNTCQETFVYTRTASWGKSELAKANRDMWVLVSEEENVAFNEK